MEEISCTKCHTPILPAYYNTPDLVSCPSCHIPIKIELFPAFLRGLPPERPGEILIDDQAGCFYHPEKKAVIPCDHCGRFLCALCDVELGTRHLCPTCVETGKKGKIIDLDRHRVLYDSAAFMLATIPIITIWFTAITAPVALYMAIRYWNAPTSIVGRTRIRFILAMGLAGIQIVAWAVWIVYLVSGR